MAGAGKRRQAKARDTVPGPTQQEGNPTTTQDFPAQGPPQYDGPSDAPINLPVRTTAAAAGWAAPESRTDPARDEPLITLATDVNRKLELPAAAYNLDNIYAIPTDLIRRPKDYNSTGKEITVRVNSFNIQAWPQKRIHQYDILIGSGVEKRALVKKIWNSKTVQSKISKSWLFDGNRIAWSLDNKPGEVVFTVDLDAESGTIPREGRENKHRVIIKQTTQVNLEVIQAYLSGKISFDKFVLEAINFMDHLMRQWPSEQLIGIKRSFFGRGEDYERVGLGGGCEVIGGVYQSIRACHGGRLGVNIDVSNCAFWTEMTVLLAAQQVVKSPTVGDMQYKLRLQLVQPHHDGGQPKYVTSEAFNQLRRLRKLRIFAPHRGNENVDKQWIIDHFDQRNSREYTFPCKNKETGEVTETSLYDYFYKKYSIALRHPLLPVVVTTKKGVAFPMEIVWVVKNQRFPFKLDENQTATMIKFAVTRPEQRIKTIERGLSMLKWKEDPYLANYGMKIDPNMVQTKARLLPNPSVQFSGGVVNPGTTGRWDLKGRKFLLPNPVPLRSWGVILYPGKYQTNKAGAENFMREFIKVLLGHGMSIENKTPLVMEGPLDPAQGVTHLWQAVGAAFNLRPQLLIFLVADKAAYHYSRIKKSCDCRYGVMSQVMQGSHVARGQAQYMSNVAMKINAKLGGTTSRVALKSLSGHFQVPSIVIGADVSHPSIGVVNQPSMAAMSVSMDKYAARYAAACSSNGERVEIISQENIKKMLMPMLKRWIETVGGGSPPQHVYYFRDGVSEGQYQHVLQLEVAQMRAAFASVLPQWKPKFIVTIASKRHHIRIFPKAGDRAAADRNGNPFPGTLVERDVTHPFEYDFYLNSHSAIQGTARPVHYHVLLDEAGLKPNNFQNMVYEQCYQYMRSTTPVSLHPAVYYAHLASNRARCHEDVHQAVGPRTGIDAGKGPNRIQGRKPPMPSSLLPTEAGPLLPINTSGGLQLDMWYI